MITAGDFRNGVTFELDGQVVQVVEFQHVKPGKGAAFVRTKYKNIITGSVVEQSFNPAAKFPTASFKVPVSFFGVCCALIPIPGIFFTPAKTRTTAATMAIKPIICFFTPSPPF